MPQKQTPAPVNDWHDVKDDWQDTTDWSDITAPTPTKPKKGLVDTWNEQWINKPLISKETTGGKWDPAGAANYYDNPMQRREDDIRIPHSLPTPFGFNIPIPEALGAGGTLKSLGAGMLEGAGDTLSSFTSPSQIALLLATMGSSAAAKSATTLPAAGEFAYKAAPAIARVGRRVAQGLSAPVVAQGGTEIYQGVKEGDYGKAARGVATTAGGVLGMSMPGLPKGAAQEPMPVKPRSTEIPYRYNEPPSTAPKATPVTQTPPVVAKAKATKAPKVGKGSQPIPEFDPSTLGFESTPSKSTLPAWHATLSDEALAAEQAKTTTPEVQFVDPKTGEIKPASQAQPGDVVLHEPQPTAEVQPTEQPVQTEQPPKKANSVAEWARQLLKDEVGEIDFGARADTPEERKAIQESRIRRSQEFRSSITGEPPSTSTQEPVAQTPVGDSSRVSQASRDTHEGMSSNDLQRRIALHQDYPPGAPESTTRQISRDLVAHMQEVLDSRSSNEPYHPEDHVPLAPVVGNEPPPSWNRREMDDFISSNRPATLRRYIRSYEDRNTPESRAIVRYGNELLNRLDEPNSETYGRHTPSTPPQTNAQIAGMHPDEFESQSQHLADRLDEVVRASEHGRDDPREIASVVSNAVRSIRDEMSGGDVSSAGLDRLFARAEELQTQTNISLWDDEHGAQESGYTSEPTSEWDPEPYQLPSSRRSPSNRVGDEALAKLEASKETRTPAFERLGRLVGKDLADELTGNQGEIQSAGKPRRATEGKKKLDSYEIEAWNKDGESWLKEEPVDESKPGMDIKEDQYYPGSFRIVWRDRNGVPKGLIKASDEGIHLATASSTLGLRRGNVALKMFAEAYKRGVRGAHGGTSDLTKNLIDRFIGLVERSKQSRGGSETGAINLADMIKAANEIFDSLTKGVSESKLGDFARSVTGRSSVKSTVEAPKVDPAARMQELFEKNQSGTLTPEELAEAKQLAKSQSSQYGSRPEDAQQSPYPQRPEPGDTGDENSPILSFPSEGPRDEYGLRIIGPRSIESSNTPEGTRTSGRPVASSKPPEEYTSQRRATKKISGMDLGPTPGGELPVRQPGVAEQQAAPELSTPKKTSRTYLEGTSKVDTGPLVPENQSAKKVTNTLGNRLQRATGGASGEGTKPPKPALLSADALNPDIPIEEHKTQAPFKTRYGAVGEVLNAPRTLQSIDLPGLTSAALRQTRPLAFTTDWFKAWGAGVKAFGSKGALDLIKSDIENGKYMQPQYQPVLDKTGQVIKYIEKPSRAESLGLKMGDIFSTREETLANSLAEKIPGYGRYVKASNRANQAFINQLRYAKFEKMMDGAEAAGRGADDVLGRKIADFANRATGRGGLGVLEPLAEEIGLALYSPRALSARLQFVNPYNYTKMDPLVRKEYWMGLARLMGSWAAFSTLGSLLPKAHVSLDPNNADFGKIRIRNTRIDPGAGWQQLMVLAHRESPVENMKTPWGTYKGGGGTTSSSGAPGQKGQFTPFGSTPMASTRLSLAGRYAYNMLSPSARFGYDLANVSKKEPFDLTDRTLQLALPMYAADIADAAKDDPGVAEIFAPLLSSMGAGVNTYEKGDFNKPKITPLIKKATGKKVPTMVFGGR